MGFSQAVSGLNAASNNLDVIGNNIANSATAGFKSSSVAFADMFAGSQVGMGVKVAGITQNFNDGTPTNTNRALDIAISNSGFFRMQDSSGGIYYGRNGQFKLDDQRNIVNMQGLHLTGFPAAGTPPAIQQGANPVPLNIPNSLLPARATESGLLEVNLNSSHSVPTVPTFDSRNDKSYSYVNSITVYDSLGNAHNMNVYFKKTDDNTWEVYSLDGSVPGANAQMMGQMSYDQNGQLTSVTPFDPATGELAVDAAGETVKNGSPFNLSMAVAPLNGSAAGQTVAMSFLGSRQQNVDSDGIKSKNQDGFAAGNLTGYQINSDGTVIGTYSNQQTQLLGQIVLSNFANPEGLASQGNNVWQETSSSGAPITGTAGGAGFGDLTSGALESSNVDLSQELVNMIVAQRNYQSNAQTIKTQDQILQTLVSLR